MALADQSSIGGRVSPRGRVAPSDQNPERSPTRIRYVGGRVINGSPHDIFVGVPKDVHGMDLLHHLVSDPTKKVYVANWESLVDIIRENHDVTYGHEKQIRRAVRFCYNAHKWQKRRSGESFFFHPKTIATELAILGQAPPEIVIAGLLHDVLDKASRDATVDRREQQLREQFGGYITRIVRGLTDYVKESFPDGYYLDRKRMASEAVLVAAARLPEVLLVRPYDVRHNLHTLYVHENPQKEAAILWVAHETLFPVVSSYTPEIQELLERQYRNELTRLAGKPNGKKPESRLERMALSVNTESDIEPLQGIVHTHLAALEQAHERAGRPVQTPFTTLTLQQQKPLRALLGRCAEYWKHRVHYNPWV
ncbi:bifunctional (p)ppGpp synthetase/guanosine-3',5'-bis(diphosphate) 3'-pyrophosphohydrolase [Candidatus Woesearchaeota archaeon]|nr:bifunctional (p)ppGpp synthetase/guanosine-3',5'-bis(diphosphate) 3'-pyrophosphohydrolase [Candidatus Woesearchaeota archaeon]MBS3142159.1 bifunctional (p)ppGpp synthetase/guanosine-3',5'-bis(diphosphate) 3'-pyrophosphohydrolase [Candidatus Woesearchaeota archaeon]